MHIPNKLELKTSTIPNAGRGIFAKELIIANTSLGEYTGKWVSKDEFEKFSDDLKQKGFEYGWEVNDYRGNKNRPKGIKLKDGITIGYIDAREETDGNYLRFINHSSTNDNVRAFQVKDKIYYLTTRDIQPGEELFVDYGPQFFT